MQFIDTISSYSLSNSALFLYTRVTTHVITHIHTNARVHAHLHTYTGAPLTHPHTQAYKAPLHTGKGINSTSNKLLKRTYPLLSFSWTYVYNCHSHCPVESAYSSTGLTPQLKPQLSNQINCIETIS